MEAQASPVPGIIVKFITDDRPGSRSRLSRAAQASVRRWERSPEAAKVLESERWPAARVDSFTIG